MDGIGRSRGRDKEIQHSILPMEQLVLSDKWGEIPFRNSPPQRSVLQGFEDCFGSIYIVVQIHKNDLHNIWLNLEGKLVL